MTPRTTNGRLRLDGTATKGTSKVLPVRLTPEEWSLLDALTIRTGLTRSEIIRAALAALAGQT